LDFINVILVISFLVFFHELGHYSVARFFGVKILKFSIGFGKPIFSKVINGTDYRISWILLGGYVQMKGQDDLNPKERNNDKDSYNSIAPWKRILVLLAGPFFNFILAFILFFTVANIGFEKLSPEIGKLMEDMPSKEAGIQTGDKILEINNQPVKYWEDISPIIQNSDKYLNLIIDRNNTVKNVIIAPKVATAENIFGEKIERKMIGISPSGATLMYQPEDIFDALNYAYLKTVDSAFLIFQSIEKLITGIVPIDQLGGVVSIVEFTAKASETGLVSLLIFSALLSVNLGVLNLLPIPALDGGHVVFNLYEWITRRIPSENIMFKLTLFGWLILLSLMIIGLFNDINRLVG
jgi:regulator of sigma E protease